MVQVEEQLSEKNIFAVAVYIPPDASSKNALKEL